MQRSTSVAIVVAALVVTSTSSCARSAASPDTAEGEGEGDVAPGEGEGEGNVAAGEGEGDVAVGEGEGATSSGEGEGEGTFDTSTKGKYDANGAGTFTKFDVDVTPSSGSTFTVHVTLPDAAGPRPVVLLGPGTQQPMSSYQEDEERWASWGIVTIGRDDPGPLVHTQVVVDDLLFVRSTWMPAQNTDASSPLFGRLDLARVGAAGHSRGGKATLLAAENGLDVLGYFGIDTVDVTFIDDGVYAETTVASVGIPTVFLTASIATSCSPANANGEVLYNDASSPSVLMTALGAGHTQFASPCVGCTLACSPSGGDVDGQVVLDYTARYSTAFFARVLLDDATVGPAFEGAGASLDVAAGLLQIESK